MIAIRVIGIIVVGSLFLFLPKIVAQTIEPATNLHSSWEQFHEAIPISGSTVMGIMNHGEQTLNKKNPTIYCNTQLFANTKLCLEISSIDGLYEANLFYDLKPTKNASIQLQFPSKFLNKLSTYHTHELSLLGWFAEDCKGEKSQYTSLSWSKYNLTDSINVFVNSDDEVELLGYDEDGEEKLNMPFKSVQSEKPIRAFNKYCRVDRLTTKNLLLIVRKRYRTGRKIKFIEYEIPLKNKP